METRRCYSLIRRGAVILDLAKSGVMGSGLATQGTELSHRAAGGAGAHLPRPRTPETFTSTKAGGGKDHNAAQSCDFHITPQLGAGG